MEDSKSVVLKPCARSLAVYYAFAISIIALFATGALIAVAVPMKNVAIDPWSCLWGAIGGLGILAIVVGIHLEMKTATYIVTETNAQSCYGLLFKNNDQIQLGAVRSIKVTQNPVQRLFNVGDIVLYTTSDSPIVMWDVDRPEKKREEIWELVTKAAAWRFRYSAQ
ncbi:MAG: PH domain-containing protein [Blastocatellia bacterium]|nr:PH domain-containing protein [Blastocatellia bacterium]